MITLVQKNTVNLPPSAVSTSLIPFLCSSHLITQSSSNTPSLFLKEHPSPALTHIKFPFSPSSLQNSVNVYLPLSRFYESVKYCLFSGSLLDPLFVQSDTWYHLLSFSESSQTHHVQPSLPLFSVPASGNDITFHASQKCGN